LPSQVRARPITLAPDAVGCVRGVDPASIGSLLIANGLDGQGDDLRDVPLLDRKRRERGRGRRFAGSARKT
jgi:hypothetical protein